MVLSNRLTRPTAADACAAERRNLETQVWQAILEVHGSVFAQLNRVMGREFGITLAKFDVLAQLHRNPDGLTQGNLSRHLKVTSGNVTGLVRRLSGEDLVTRQMSPDDRRAFLVKLTSLGTEKYLAARARHDVLLEEWFRDLGTDGKEGTLKFLQAMTSRVARPSKAARS